MNVWGAGWAGTGAGAAVAAKKTWKGAVIGARVLLGGYLSPPLSIG